MIMITFFLLTILILIILIQMKTIKMIANGAKMVLAATTMTVAMTS